MTRQGYIIGLAFVTMGLWAWQWPTSLPANAEQIEHQQAPAPLMDKGAKAIETANPAKKKAVLEAVSPPEGGVHSLAMESVGPDRREGRLGYRPLCGLSTDAINHYACATGYDNF